MVVVVVEEEEEEEGDSDVVFISLGEPEQAAHFLYNYADGNTCSVSGLQPFSPQNQCRSLNKQ